MTGRELTDASNVLVVGPASVQAVVETTAGLSREEFGDSYQLLTMTFNQSPAQWLTGFEDANGGLPERVGIVGVGDRSQATTFSDTFGDRSVPADVEIVADPSDLPRLGITLSEFVAKWDDAVPIVLAFDSITAFLQYADLQSVYRFVQTLKGRLDSANGLGLYFMNPAAHDDQTMATVRPLFDVVREDEPDTTVESVE